MSNRQKLIRQIARLARRARLDYDSFQDVARAVRRELGLRRPPRAISVMTTYGHDSGAAERAISEVSRRVLEYFERLARSNAQGVRLP